MKIDLNESLEKKYFKEEMSYNDFKDSNGEFDEDKFWDMLDTEKGLNMYKHIDEMIDDYVYTNAETCTYESSSRYEPGGYYFDGSYKELVDIVYEYVSKELTDMFGLNIDSDFENILRTNLVPLMLSEGDAAIYNEKSYTNAVINLRDRLAAEAKADAALGYYESLNEELDGDAFDEWAEHTDEYGDLDTSAFDMEKIWKSVIEEVAKNCRVSPGHTATMWDPEEDAHIDLDDDDTYEAVYNYILDEYIKFIIEHNDIPNFVKNNLNDPIVREYFNSYFKDELPSKYYNLSDKEYKQLIWDELD